MPAINFQPRAFITCDRTFGYFTRFKEVLGSFKAFSTFSTCLSRIYHIYFFDTTVYYDHVTFWNIRREPWTFLPFLIYLERFFISHSRLKFENMKGREYLVHLFLPGLRWRPSNSMLPGCFGSRRQFCSCSWAIFFKQVRQPVAAFLDILCRRLKKTRKKSKKWKHLLI